MVKDKDMNVNVYYVYHSCFIVKLDSCYMMFDYFKNLENEKEQDFDFDSLIKAILESNKPFYIFSSHSHSDHFNKNIFDFDSPYTTYILSNDITHSKASSNIHYMGSGNTLTVDDILITAFPSTDLGISFLINLKDIVIFHAGDLNWWAWSDDTKEEAEYMENLYKNAIDQIKAYDKIIDIAFFPVDKRLEENFYMGGNYFIDSLHPKTFIPMHFGNDYDATQLFYDKCQDTYPDTKIIKISSINKKII